MRMEVEKLTAPPASYGIYSSANDDETVNVYVTGRKLKVNLHPSIRVKELRKGQEVILNEALNVIESRGFDLQGEVVRLKDNLDGKRAVVTLRTDEERVAELAEPLLMQRLSVGDHLLFDARSGYLLEKLPKSEVEELVLEEVPDIKYTDIGGLHDQIEQIQDAVELPVLHPELFKEHKLRAWQDAHREGSCQFDRAKTRASDVEGSPQFFSAREGTGTSEQIRRGIRA